MKTINTKKVFFLVISLAVMTFVMNNLPRQEMQSGSIQNVHQPPKLIRGSTFISSPADFIALNCSFYLKYQEFDSYQVCKNDLRYLKQGVKNINQTLVTHRFPSCAVVGSSFDLLKAKHGAQISSHDKIFRINEAPSKGYEEHVGNRTDFRVMHASMLHENFHNEKFMRIVSLHEGRTASYQKVANHFNPQTDLIFHPNALKELSQQIAPYDIEQYEISMIHKMHERIRTTSYCSPSSGIRGIYAALSLCEKVTSYGFSSEYKGNDTWSYFRKESLVYCPGCWENVTQTAAHCFQFERKLQKSWVENSLELFGSYFSMVMDQHISN